MTTQPAPAIHVQGLEKSYKTLHVLRGVDYMVKFPADDQASASLRVLTCQ